MRRVDRKITFFDKTLLESGTVLVLVVGSREINEFVGGVVLVRYRITIS